MYENRSDSGDVEFDSNNSMEYITTLNRFNPPPPFALISGEPLPMKDFHRPRKQGGIREGDRYENGRAVEMGKH